MNVKQEIIRFNIERQDKTYLDVKAYLARIGISEIPDPSLENLRLLQSSHLLNVPFENLNIHIYNRLSQDPRELFEKIVLQRRGGICYELNLMYMLLLQKIGYDVTYHGGRVTDEGTFFDHTFIIAKIDGIKYITDVGFGDNFMYPMKFEADLLHKDPKGDFIIDYEGGGYYALWKMAPGKPVKGYTFTLNIRKPSDFTERRIFYTTDPSSPFHKNLICSIEKRDGRVSLKQSKLMITNGSQRSQRKIDNFHHYITLLYDNFGIVLSPDERRKLKKSRFWNKKYNQRKTHALLMASSIQQTFINKMGTLLGG